MADKHSTSNSISIEAAPQRFGDQIEDMTPEQEKHMIKVWEEMGLRSAIEQAQRYGSEQPAPPNESSTCEWVILPLLWAAGYEKWEIVSRVSDGNQSFPDYTFLPDKPEHTWYLEAKAWSIALDDRHVSQALNYSHQNGKRWVVLTNGQQWRLYDDRVWGMAKVKLVVEVKLTDTEGMCQLLSALSPTAVTTGGIEAYAHQQGQQLERAERQGLLWKTLDYQLTEADSSAVQALLNSTREVDGLEGVTASEIVGYFGRGVPPITQTIPSVQPKDLLPEPTTPVFWQHFRELAKQLDFPTTSRTDPWTNSQYDVKRLNSWATFRYFVRSEEAWAEIRIEGDNPATVKSRFDYLCSKRKEIEQAFLSPLVWEYKPGQKLAKIRHRLPGAGINEVKNWPVLHAAMIETMKRLMSVTTPYLLAAKG